MPHKDSLFSQILSLVDVLCQLISPLAVIAFVVLAIIALDGFGEHTRMLRGLEQDGVEGRAIWPGGTKEDGLVVVWLDPPQHGQDMICVDTRYYSAATLARLAEGQAVRIRYTYPPEHEAKGVLVAAYDQVTGYHGYLAELFWPFVFCLVVLGAHPEVLVVGLIPDEPGAAQTPATPAPAAEKTKP